MKKNILILLLGVMFVFGGSLDTVSDPLVKSYDIDQVGYVEFVADNNVVAINLEISQSNGVNASEFVANHFRVRPSILYAVVDGSMVRNKSSGILQGHGRINNNKNSLPDDIPIKSYLYAHALKIKQEKNQANVNKLAFPLLC